MTHIQFIDELIREYLLFRGFAGTLKTFDIELKQDKEKGFRVSIYFIDAEYWQWYLIPTKLTHTTLHK